MSIENYQPLELNLSKGLDDIVEFVEEYYEATNSALINTSRENDLAMSVYAETLTHVLFDNPGNEQWTAVYKAIQFSIEINELAGIPYDRLPIKEDLSGVKTDQELREKLTEDANDYMSRNTALDSITGRFMSEIDQYDRNSAEAWIVVALISRQMERRQLELRTEYEISSWNGQID